MNTKEKMISLEQVRLVATEFKYNIVLMQAVMAVEAPKGGFISDGRPTILFERHKFFDLLPFLQKDKLVLEKQHPNICNRKPGGYALGKDQNERTAREWDRLELAKKIHEEAALKSTSWGRGQIMGEHHSQAGFASVKDMVKAFSENEYNQVLGMMRLIKARPKCDAVMKTAHPTLIHCRTFALYYNGKYYEKNNYHTEIFKHYNHLLVPTLGK
jgi:hypothetical protein